MNGEPGRTISIALFQPDIPQNLGNLMRTAACFGVPLAIIEPCGFVLSDKRLKRAGMDYPDSLDLIRHASWAAFVAARAAAPAPGRLVLLTTRADLTLPAFRFEVGDTLLLGRESAGVPDDVHRAADARLALPMRAGLRSLNVAVAGAVAVFEALRQLQALPGAATMPANTASPTTQSSDDGEH